jgi:MSHA biogenesis protein MshJ
MKALLKRQALRIDALSLRERAIMFASIAVALVAAADAIVFTPRFAEQRALTKQMQARTAEVETMRRNLAGGAENPAARMTGELSSLQNELKSIDAEIERRLADGRAGLRLPALLEHVLRRHERLTLLRLATVEAPAAAASKPALPQQGVELALRGNYADLARYVAEIERELPALRWGELVVKSAGTASELSVRVYLVGETS